MSAPKPVIEKDIPITRMKGTGKSGKYRDLFVKMALHDSFLIECGENSKKRMMIQKNVIASAKHHREYHDPEFAIITRKAPKGLRVWRSWRPAA